MKGSELFNVVAQIGHVVGGESLTWKIGDRRTVYKERGGGTEEEIHR